MRQIIAGVVTMLALFAVLQLSSVAPAQSDGGAASAKPPPIVSITKSDGSTVRGTIVSADPDQVIVQPPKKPSEKEEPAQVTISWKEIKRISNGLTHAKALQSWREANREKLCDTCHGFRTLLCDTCRGTAHDPKAGENCNLCKGELLVDCKQRSCEGGKIACPSPCLKLSEGQWYKKPDGLRWRKFPMKGGFAEFSERHLGELVSIEGDKINNKGKCPTCGGTTEIICTSCHGIEQVPCPTCVARKGAPPCPADCEAGTMACTECKGSGLRT